MAISLGLCRLRAVVATRLDHCCIAAAGASCRGTWSGGGGAWSGGVVGPRGLPGAGASRY